MKKNKKVITRRDFIRTGSCMVMGSVMGLPVLGHSASRSGAKSRVVLVRDKKSIAGNGSVQNRTLEKMLDQAVTALYNADEPAAAWRQIAGPADIVGIKSNVWSPLPTPPVLEETLVARLTRAGVSERNISVDDRGIGQNPVFQNSTALINIRPLRTHHWSGLGTLLKNYIMFVPQPWKYHGNSCERLGAIWNKPGIRGKTRLNILVMLTPLFHGIGPHHFSRKYLWPYGGLIVSRDPVAADATGARIIQAQRIKYFGKDRPISPPPRHIQAADTQFGLGNSHPERIQLIKLGWSKDMLI
jgi:hypothetical protein